ncbi:hypothetical protein IJ670_03215 [bacterium]|nr:hypothetical protein [bacterium]
MKIFENNKYKSKRNIKTQQGRQFQSGAVTNPTKIKQDSQIISGYFLDEKPYKEIIIQRINNFLYCVLGILVLFCFVCYYFVSCKEVQLKRISRETLELNYENDDLQNKLDGLQSYYKIDQAVSKANILERAHRVVEVDAIDLPNLDLKKQKDGKHNVVVSY